MILDPKQDSRLAVIAQAAQEMRALAEAANTDDERRPYGNPHVPPVSEDDWGKLVDNYLGDAIGTHCAAWPPRTAIAIADVLAGFLADYETAVDHPDCPACGSGCSGHSPVLFHDGDGCGENVTDCRCLEPYLTIAGAFVSRGIPLAGGS